MALQNPLVVHDHDVHLLTDGADGYVTKPIDADAVIKAAKTVIGLPGNPFDKRSKES